MFCRQAISLLAGLVLGATGCGQTATKRACTGGSGQSSLVTDAAMVRLDVYGASAHCADAATLAAGAGAPTMSRTFLQGQAITLDVPPGPHALVLSTFADTDGLQLLGVGCTEANVSAGSQICFDLTVQPAPDGGDDLSAVSATCSTNPDSCGPGQFCNGLSCVPGCRSDADCAGPGGDAGTSATPRCDLTTHQCVQCLVPSDCPMTDACTGEKCVPFCATGTKYCNGSCIPVASCCSAADCTSPPTPSACYTASCPTPGGSCQYNVKSGAQVCGTTCCLPIGGACNANCTLACNNGLGDCDGNRTNGCETSTTTTTNCGGCGNVCDTTTSLGATCQGGSCQYTGCVAGWADCQTGSPDTNGCETHTDSDVNNCGACGRPCSTLNTVTRQCTSGTCNSTCQSGFGNCSMPAAGSMPPYTADDGCESNLTTCEGTACCSMSSPTPAGMCAPPANGHINGTGQTYADCSPPGTPGTNTYTVQMANEAANADTLQPGSIVSGVICCNCNTPNEIDAVCKSSNGNLSGGSGFTCTCWSYLGMGNQVTNVGYTTGATTKSCSCVAANPALQWN